jgi:hypothetical protein
MFSLHVLYPLKETGHQLGGLSIGDAPWIDAVTIPTADRNRGIDPRQNRPGHRVRLIENAVPVLFAGADLDCNRS